MKTYDIYLNVLDLKQVDWRPGHLMRGKDGERDGVLLRYNLKDSWKRSSMAIEDRCNRARLN